MADIKISAFPDAPAAMSTTDKATGLQGGANVNFTGTRIETFINRSGGTLNLALALKAPLASPTFTGIPIVPTAAPGTNTTQAASTAFVATAISGITGSGGDPAYPALVGTTWDGTPASITLTADTDITLTSTLNNGNLHVKQDSIGGWELSINGAAPPIAINSAPDSVSAVYFSFVEENPGELRVGVDTSFVIVASGDTTPPGSPVPVVADTDPLRVAVTFDETLDVAHVPVAADFSVSGHTTSGLVIVSGNTCYVPVSAPFVEGEAARTIAYTPGLTANKLQDAAGNLVVAFSGLAITNSVTEPALTSATVQDSTPSQVDLVFDEGMNATWSAPAAFTVSGHTVSSVTRLTATTGYLTLATPLVAGEVAPLDYTQPVSNKMKDLGGTLLPSFTGATVTNLVGSGSVYPYTQGFEGVAVGALPSGWDSNGPVVSAGSAMDGTKQLEISTGSPLTQLAVFGTIAPLSCTVAAKIKAVGGDPEMGIYQRADSATASSVANAFVMRVDVAASHIDLYKKVGGTFTLITTVLANLTLTHGITYLLTYSINGSHLHVASLQRMSDSLYYDPASGWVVPATNFLSTTDSSISAAGYPGVYGALTGGATNIYFDTFSAA